MPHHCPRQREEIESDEEKQCKNKDLDQAREKTRINIRVISELEELRDLSGLFCFSSKDCCLIILCFKHKSKMTVTVILAIAHIAVRCCSQATRLVGKSSLLACMLICHCN